MILIVNKKSGLSVLSVAVLLILFSCTPGYGRSKKQADSPWDLSAGVDYLSRYFKYGIDLGADQPALDWHIDVTHKQGWVFGGDLATVMDGSSFEEGLLYGGYEYSFSDNFFLRGEFSHSFYSDDSANVIASLSNEVSLEAGLEFDPLAITFSYEHFFDDVGANYYGVNVLSAFETGKFVITPTLDISFISQTVPNAVLIKYKQKGKKSIALNGTSQAVSGLDGFQISVEGMYELGSGFSAVFTPSFVYSPQSDLAFRTTQFIWTVGIAYSGSL
jgi:hypothetical protein